MSDITSLPVEFLFHLHATLNPPFVVPNGPLGTRVIVPVTGGTVVGPKVNGTVENFGGDWLTMRPDGSAQLDVRIIVTTDDGATLSVTYKGVAAPDKDGKLLIVTAPLVETGDERYAWLTTLQAVAIGRSGDNVVDYDVYRLV